MRFSEASGHKIVSTATAENVGKLDAFVVDPVTRSVVALTLKKTADGDTLPWGDIVGFGADAVTVADAAKIVEAPADLAELTGKDHHLLGKRLLSSGGDELGKVKDVDFDPATGTVTSIITKEHEVPGSALVGVGSYAVVVTAQ
jgi:sporulation protein YlmC with PRC-barrel domain